MLIDKLDSVVSKPQVKPFIQFGFELVKVPVFSDDMKKNILKRAELIMDHVKP